MIKEAGQLSPADEKSTPKLRKKIYCKKEKSSVGWFIQ